MIITKAIYLYEIFKFISQSRVRLGGYKYSDIINHYVYPCGIPAIFPKWPKKYRQMFGRFNHETIIDLAPPNDLSKWKDRLSVGGETLFIDVGCWKGFGTLRASGFTNNLIAVEADSRNYLESLVNFKTNGKDVQLLNAAAGSLNGSIGFASPSSEQRSDGQVAPRWDTKVKSVMVDDVVEKTYDHAMISVTINDNEIDALRGMKKVLSFAKVGINTICRTASQYYEMKEFLLSFGIRSAWGESMRVLGVK